MKNLMITIEAPDDLTDLVAAELRQDSATWAEVRTLAAHVLEWWISDIRAMHQAPRRRRPKVKP